MKVSRQPLCDLPGVYSVSTCRVNNGQCVLAASELRGGSCVLIDPATREVFPVWTSPGGTMSIVPLDGPHLYAVQQFYAGFDAAASVIVEAQADKLNGHWHVREKLKLPYLHRLAAVGTGEERTLLACTLCAGKASVDDWSKPGGVFRIAPNGSNGSAWKPVPVLEGLRRNHGLSVTRMGGSPVALVSGMEGLFSISLPGGTAAPWTVEQLLDWDVSDMAAIDWDGDEQEELVTIEPFHGDRFVFYKRAVGGHWRRIHEIPCLLGHSLWAGRALGRYAVIAGERMGEGRIQVVFPSADAPAKWAKFAVDTGTGGTNVAVLQATESCLQFVSANNDRNQVLLYSVEA